MTGVARRIRGWRQHRANRWRPAWCPVCGTVREEHPRKCPPSTTPLRGFPIIDGKVRLPSAAVFIDDPPSEPATPEERARLLAWWREEEDRRKGRY